ncbi:MAG: hypothetical protein WBY66_12810, partial [Candidatus Acidiferrales bacterium]
TLANPIEETLPEFELPQREAAFFYGLFLRGHSAEELRRDIQVPATVLAILHNPLQHRPQLGFADRFAVPFREDGRGHLDIPPQFFCGMSAQE